ncbi:MAG: hypothetical protein PHY39_05385 [Endomicrobiaceae bacterium]|nr:hypothetical protein [Endomicrobiaceae bacterium]
MKRGFNKRQLTRYYEYRLRKLYSYFIRQKQSFKLLNDYIILMASKTDVDVEIILKLANEIGSTKYDFSRAEQMQILYTLGYKLDEVAEQLDLSCYYLRKLTTKAFTEEDLFPRCAELEGVELRKFFKEIDKIDNQKLL